AARSPWGIRSGPPGRVSWRRCCASSGARADATASPRCAWAGGWGRRWWWSGRSSPEHAGSRGAGLGSLGQAHLVDTRRKIHALGYLDHVRTRAQRPHVARDHPPPGDVEDLRPRGAGARERERDANAARGIRPGPRELERQPGDFDLDHPRVSHTVVAPEPQTIVVAEPGLDGTVLVHKASKAVGGDLRQR